MSRYVPGGDAADAVGLAVCGSGFGDLAESETSHAPGREKTKDEQAKFPFLLLFVLILKELLFQFLYLNLLLFLLLDH